jgi:hypothetical protein
MSEIITYKDPAASAPVQVTLEGDTVWLTQAQMAEFFWVKPQNITMHLKKIYADDELQEAATCRDFLQVRSEGPRKVERKRKFYNLDAIISVGYRVNSKSGVRFRQWATSLLRQHLLKGYTRDQNHQAKRGPNEAQAALELLSRTLEANALVDDTGRTIVELLSGYARIWSLLLPEGCQPARGVLAYDQAKAAMKRSLRNWMFGSRNRKRLPVMPNPRPPVSMPPS